MHVRLGEDHCRLHYCVTQDTEDHITQAGWIGQQENCFHQGRVLLAMHGHCITRGKLAILGIEARKMTEIVCRIEFPGRCWSTLHMSTTSYRFAMRQFEKWRMEDNNRTSTWRSCVISP